MLFFKPLPKKLPITLLSLSVIFFSLYFLGHMLFLNPRYHSARIYYPFYILLPFIVFSCLEKETIKRIFKYGVFILLLLSFWGLLQHFTGLGVIVSMGGRANAIFYTPNTFAAAINLFLLPLIALYVYPVRKKALPELSNGVNGRGTKKILICGLILYSALLAANSRGGYLALTTGFLFLICFLRWQILKEYRHRLLILAAGFAAVTLIFKLLGIMGLSIWDTKRVFDAVEHGETNRLVLYSIALKLIKENPWWGFGFFNFSSLFAIHKIPPFLDSTTNFVHNDYLQFWLENGLLGLLSLLAVITSFYFSVLKKRNEILKQQPPVLIMVGAAVTSIFAHAVVDFPLYIPALLVVLGAFLGTANRELTDMGMSQ
ncbi:MAG: O-antigen ligase family protein, partial [Planctomycetota bacterium]